MTDENAPQIRVLVVDDDADTRRALARQLESIGYAVTVGKSGREGLDRALADPPHIALLDIHMPEMDGLEVLAALRGAGSDIPVLIMSGGGTIELAVRSVQHGAYDFLEKPFRRERLVVSIENALRVARIEKRAHALDQDRGEQELVGISPGMTRLRALIERAAPSDGRVLIHGESGTGKELVARALHRLSKRKDAPFVKMNCAAVPSELIESELFGHVKGAFTGATASRKGKFELADGGTMLLDEVGDMPLVMQAKLLRLLEEGEVEPVGAQSPRRVDVRVLAATHRDLGKMVEEQSFREDLYYRLQVLTIEIPPLRGRLEDIPELVTRFVQDIGTRPTAVFDPSAMQRLQAHDYPGNVRELRNLVERLLILAPQDRIAAEDVEFALSGVDRRGGSSKLYQPGKTLREMLADAERRIIEEALSQNDGSMASTARAIGLERSHLYKKVKALGIERD